MPTWSELYFVEPLDDRTTMSTEETGARPAPLRGRLAAMIAATLQHARGRLGAEALLVIVGTVVTIVGQAATLKIVSTYLSRTSFGLFALANSALALPQSVLFGSLFLAMVRRVPEAVRVGWVRALVARTHELARPLLGGLFVVGALGAAALQISNRPKEATLVGATVLLSYAAYRGERTQNLEHAARLRGTMAAHRGIDLATRAVLAWVVLLSWTAPAAPVLCFALGSLAANAYFERRVLNRLEAPSEAVQDPLAASAERRVLLRLGLPLAAATLFSWTLTNTDRWFVERFVSLESAALYVAAAQLSAIPFTVVAGLLSNFAGPILYGKADHDPAAARRWVHRLALAYFVVSACGWTVLVFLRGPVVRLMLGRNLWDAADLVPLVSAGWALIHLSTIYHLGVVAAGRTRQLLVPNVASALAAVGAHWLLIPRMGVAGAGWGLVVGGLVRVASMAWAGERAWRQNQGERGSTSRDVPLDPSAG